MSPEAIAALRERAERCVVTGCRGTMRIKGVSNDGRTREWRCDANAHTWVQLQDGTRRVEKAPS